MIQTQLQYQAQALRLEKIILATSSILLYVAALFTSAILPSLLMQYVFKSTNPFEAPQLITYIPVVAFLVATGYFVYALAIMIGKASQIKRLEKEMDDCISGDCCGGMEELVELEKLAEKAIKTAKKPAKAKKSRKAGSRSAGKK